MTEHRDAGRWSARREKQMSLFEMFLNTVFNFTTRPQIGLHPSAALYSLHDHSFQFGPFLDSCLCFSLDSWCVTSPYRHLPLFFSFLMSILHYLLPPSLSFYFLFLAGFALLFENGKFILSFQRRVGLHLSAVHDILLLVSPLPDLTTHYIYNVVYCGLQRNSILCLAIISDRGVLK